MKLKSHTILIAAQALATLSLVIILAVAAKKCFFFADFRVLTTSIAQQAGCFTYPPSEAEAIRKKLYHDRAMSLARQESEKWNKLGRMLLFAEIIPVVLIGTLLWSVSMEKKIAEQKN